MSAEAKAGRVRALVLDIDGVLTDGRLLISPSGEVTKSFNIHDGHALVLMRRELDFPIAWITGRNDPVNAQRADDLGITRLEQGVHDKVERASAFAGEVGCALDEVAFMGDDINDLPLLTVSGFATAPANACRDVLERVDWISQYDGGAGAVRELCELICRQQNTWERIVSSFE